jgi:hypothetical protein
MRIQMAIEKSETEAEKLKMEDENLKMLNGSR